MVRRNQFPEPHKTHRRKPVREIILDHSLMVEEISRLFHIPEKAISRMMQDRTVRRHMVRDPQIGTLKIDPDGVARILTLYGVVEWQK